MPFYFDVEQCGHKSGHKTWCILMLLMTLMKEII